MEQWDIGNAFLKGFSFKVMREMCGRFGITVPDVERQVFITVPGNVWYYLHEEGFYLDTSYRTMHYVRELLKAMYGLVDAPILWSIAPGHFMICDTHGKPSRYDENCFYLSLIHI